jgi:hypothetical protein
MSGFERDHVALLVVFIEAALQRLSLSAAPSTITTDGRAMEA